MGQPLTSSTSLKPIRNIVPLAFISSSLNIGRRDSQCVLWNEDFAHIVMEDISLFKKIGSLRTRGQRRVNDIHIWCSLAIIALKHSVNDDAVLRQREFSVPSPRADKTVIRKPAKVKQIISAAIGRDLYSSVLVYIVAHVEAFLNDIVALVLWHDTRRLKTRVPNLESARSVELADVVDSVSRDQLIRRIIEKQLVSLFYAGPVVQFDYYEKVLGVTVKDSTKHCWIEMKATRDVLIHNSGIINNTYVQKCGPSARGQLHELIAIDKEYFEQAVTCAKSLVGTISSQLQRAFKPKAKAAGA